MTVRSLCWAKMIKQACVLCTWNLLGKSLCHFFHVRTSQFVCHLVVLLLPFRQHINQLFDVFLNVVAGSQYTELICTRTLDQHS